MTGNLRSRHDGTRRWATGIAVAGGAIAAAAAIGIGTAPNAMADDGDIADLLGQAATNFTGAEQVFDGVPSTELPDLVLYQTNVADLGSTDVNDLTGVGVAESSILSYDNGEFANLLTPFFTDLNQSWLQASEGLLSANTALVTSFTDGTGLSAAELGVIAPDLQVMSDQFLTGIIDQYSYLLSMF